MLRHSKFLLVALFSVLVIVVPAKAEKTKVEYDAHFKPKPVEVEFVIHLKSRPAELSVTPDSLDFDEQQVSRVLTITNLGDSVLTWQMTVSDGSKLGLSKAQGTLGAKGSEKVTVSVKRENLVRGTYQAKIQVTSNGGNQEVAVSFSVPNHDAKFVDVPGKQTAYIGDTVELIIKGKDADGDALTLTIDPELPLPGAKIELLESGDIYVWRVTYSSDKPGTVKVSLIIDDGQP